MAAIDRVRRLERSSKTGRSVDVLVDLSQEHSLESVELRRHLLGEVLEVGRLDHLQTLAERKENSRGFNFQQNLSRTPREDTEGGRRLNILR